MKLLNFFGKGGWAGMVEITAIDLNGNIIDVARIKNKITDDGLDMLRDGISGVISDVQVKRLAWGSDNTPVSAAHSDLIVEVGRKQITSWSSGATGITVGTTYVAPYEAVFQIEELGWFAGVDAGDGAGSGIMVARVLYSRNKTALEALQVVRTDTFSEVP